MKDQDTCEHNKDGYDTHSMQLDLDDGWQSIDIVITYCTKCGKIHTVEEK